MPREERGKCGLENTEPRSGSTAGAGRREGTWATACVWGVGIQSFRESHTNGSISKTHASHTGNHGSLKDIKVLPDFRETFMKKKCCFILQLNKMTSPNTKKT